MKSFKTTHIFFLSLLIFNTSYAQEIKPQTNNMSAVGPVKINQGFSGIDLSNLNMLLSKQDYTNFYELFKKPDVSASEQIQFLESKKYDGHTPLYWLMAEYYAKANNPSETHKWLYIATIMTQQDASLCTDTTAKFASQKLLRSFPAAPELTRKTPQYISSAIPEVRFFIENLKTRTDPIWVCGFGNNQLSASTAPLLPKQSWALIRKRVLQTYTEGSSK